MKICPLPVLLYLKRGQLFLVVSTGDLFGVSGGATGLQLATGFRGKRFSDAHVAYLHQLSKDIFDLYVCICLNTLIMGVTLCKCACVWVSGSSKLPIITDLGEQHSKFVLGSPGTHHFVVLNRNEPTPHHGRPPVH